MPLSSTRMIELFPTLSDVAPMVVRMTTVRSSSCQNDDRSIFEGVAFLTTGRLIEGLIADTRHRAWFIVAVVRLVSSQERRAIRAARALLPSHLRALGVRHRRCRHRCWQVR